MKFTIYILFLLFVIIILLIYTFHKNNEKFYSEPNKIYLSYKNKNIPDYIIPNIKKIYTDYEIKLYDNNDCIKYLKEEYGQLYVDIFNFLIDGPIKADFWRLCILYKYGGTYFDIDLEHFNNINKIIEDNVYLTTIIIDPSYRTNKRDFNPAIIIVKSNNEIIKKCIDVYLEKYKNKIKYDYWEYSIVTIMSNVLYEELNQEIRKDGIYYDKNKRKYQFLLEVVPKNNSQAYIEYKNIKYCNSRYSTYKEHTF
jgi:hypothetical protein